LRKKDLIATIPPAGRQMLRRPLSNGRGEVTREDRGFSHHRAGRGNLEQRSVDIAIIIIIYLTPIEPIKSYKGVSNEVIYRRNPLGKKTCKLFIIK
jgi:hypothetical protein